MVSRALAAVTLLLAAPAAAGCFDVQMTNPGPYVLDNFEDGDFLPSDPIFDPWTCFAFNPDTNRMYRCDKDAGAYNSKYSLSLEFTITDQANDKQANGGAGLASFAAKPVDLSHFERLDFNVSLASGNPAISSAAQLQVELGCSTAPDEEGHMPGNLYVSRSADYGTEWQSNRLTLNNFATPNWVTTPSAEGSIGPRTVLTCAISSSTPRARASSWPERPGCWMRGWS